MPRESLPPPTPRNCRDTLGLSPAALAKRELNIASIWCPKPPYPEYDQYSDPKKPKAIHYNHVMKANKILKSIVPATPLLKSKICQKFDMLLYFKVETRHATGSFHERSAIYVLRKLSSEQRKCGVYTASVGNWAMALAHQGHLLKIQVTVVLPTCTSSFVVNQCQDFGATVVLYGKNIDEAKTYAFQLIADQGHVGTYLNGYDHPNVIAGAGCIGVELLEQLPETDAILVPIGGGGLIAGIATVVKHIKPAVLIYGIEAAKSCSFAKAVDNERPYWTAAEKSLAASLTVPKAGDNAFHTARSLVDKLVLVHDDWTARAILHLIEEENIVAEGAGAISLGALMCIPNILPELRGKTVVCIVSGGNIDLWHLQRTIVHGKAAEGRIFTMTIRVVPGKDIIRNKILKLMKYMQCNIIYSGVEQDWLEEDKLLDSYITIICETKNIKQANALKNLIEKFFPNTCEFTGDAFKHRTRCACLPTLLY